MRRWALVAGIVTALDAEAVWAQPSGQTAVPTAIRAHVRAERFQIVTSVRGLPLGVRDELQRLFGSQSLDIAEPGAPFLATNSGDTALPIRRLALAACAQDHCLVYYERGGTRRSWRAALFHWTPVATRLVAGGTAPGSIASVAALRDVVLAGLPAATVW